MRLSILLVVLALSPALAFGQVQTDKSKQETANWYDAAPPLEVIHQQEKEAKATYERWIVGTGVATVVVLVFQFIGLVWQVRTARDTMRRQLRAYGSAIVGPIIDQTETTRLEFRPNIKNLGQTPAYDVRYNAVARIIPFNLATDFNFSLPPEPPTSSLSTIGAQQEFFMVIGIDGGRNLTPAEYNEVRNIGTNRIFVYGRIFYDDAFGQQHRTNFCYYIIWGSLGIPVLMTFNRHNEAD